WELSRRLRGSNSRELTGSCAVGCGHLSICASVAKSDGGGVRQAAMRLLKSSARQTAQSPEASAEPKTPVHNLSHESRRILYRNNIPRRQNRGVEIHLPRR